MPIDENALQLLLDEHAIRALVARYADAVVRRDPETWAATWSEDAVWDMGLAKPQGRDAIVQTWQALMERFRFVTQLPQHGTIALEGDAATGRWQLIELAWPESGAGQLTLGHYDDRYRRTTQGWRFQRRVFRILYAGPADLSGSLLGHPDAPLG